MYMWYWVHGLDGTGTSTTGSFSGSPSPCASSEEVSELIGILEGRKMRRTSDGVPAESSQEELTKEQLIGPTGN